MVLRYPCTRPIIKRHFINIHNAPVIDTDYTTPAPIVSTDTVAHFKIAYTCPPTWYPDLSIQRLSFPDARGIRDQSVGPS